MGRTKVEAKLIYWLFHLATLRSCCMEVSPFARTTRPQQHTNTSEWRRQMSRGQGAIYAFALRSMQHRHRLHCNGSAQIVAPKIVQVILTHGSCGLTLDKPSTSSERCTRITMIFGRPDGAA